MYASSDRVALGILPFELQSHAGARQIGTQSAMHRLQHAIKEHALDGVYILEDTGGEFTNDAPLEC